MDEVKTTLGIKEEDIKDPSKPFADFVNQIEETVKKSSSGA